MEDVNANQKVREIITAYNLSDNAFAKIIGVTQSVISSMFQKNTEPSAKVIKLILKAFPDLSAEWLLRNVGTMKLSHHHKYNTGQTVLLIDTISTLTAIIKEKDIRIRELEAKFIDNNKKYD